jgi:hypothetical protein
LDATRCHIRIEQSVLGRIAREFRRGLPGESSFTLGPIDNEIDASAAREKIAEAYAQIYLGVEERTGVRISMSLAVSFVGEVFEHYEVPFVESPLRGTTLNSLISGGTLALMQLYLHQSPLDAAIAVLYTSGAIIILGAADAVRRAVSAAIEERLRSVLGVPMERTVMRKNRESAASLRRRSRS